MQLQTVRDDGRRLQLTLRLLEQMPAKAKADGLSNGAIRILKACLKVDAATRPKAFDLLAMVKEVYPGV